MNIVVTMRKAIFHLKKSDPIMRAIIERVGPCLIEFGEPTFHSLAEAIIYQQLNGKAAVTIFKRFTDAAGTPVTPEGILKLSLQQMRAVGLSKQKSSYLLDLAAKTQSGLLECMQERHVTVDVHTHELARPFVVMATQNPVEYEGTYPLPEAQLDRFMVRVALGYPEPDEEAEMLAQHAEGDRVLELEPVANVSEVLAAQAAAGRVHASDALRRYVVAVLEATRDDPRLELGASPRAGLMLLKASKALAALEGRDHALPDDVQALAEAVLPHRLLLAPEAAGSTRAHVVRAAIERVPAL